MKSTFAAVDDSLLVELIEAATRRVVLVAPGLHMPVAQALCKRFEEIERLEVTVVIDADEDVCRIGFGELAALTLVQREATNAGFWVRY